MKRAFLTAVIGVPFALGLSGCGSNKTEIPTKLDQPLPPPPVGAGGGGKTKGGTTDAGGGKGGTTSVDK
jgi:hypothetical protein